MNIGRLAQRLKIAVWRQPASNKSPIDQRLKKGTKLLHIRIEVRPPKNVALKSSIAGLVNPIRSGTP
jgi:hypothetical protein